MNKQETLKNVGTAITGATKDNLAATVNAAQAIAAIVQAKMAGAIPLLAGDRDVLPSLHSALGSGLSAGRDLHVAQLKTLQLAKRLGLIDDELGVPSCDCFSALLEARRGTALALAK